MRSLVFKSLRNKNGVWGEKRVHGEEEKKMGKGKWVGVFIGERNNQI